MSFLTKEQIIAAGYEYELEERAAILELNGMPKEKAEAQALREIGERIERMKRG